MKNITLLLTIVLMSIGLLGCQKSDQVEKEQESTNKESLSKYAEVTKDDFVYRLITEKVHYPENGTVKIYAELEYIGKEDEVEIIHADSPFYFPMTETTRKYEIDYAMTLQGRRTTLKKGEPFRQDARGGGGYSEHDAEDYKEFMKQMMSQKFPSGHYIVNGYAEFALVSDEEKRYNMKAEVEFYVDGDN